MTEGTKKRIINLFEAHNGDLTQKELAKKVNTSTITVSIVLTEYFKNKMLKKYERIKRKNL